MSEIMTVEPRTKLGKIHNRRLRDEGRLPAILYGHGETPVSLSVSTAQFAAALRHGAKVVDLQGAVKQKALVQSLAWDTFRKNVLHIDFLRVSADEKVSVEIPVDLKGDAPGLNNGGILEHQLHMVEIEVDPAHMPDRLHASVANLQLGGSIYAGDITDLPAGAKLITPADAVLVNCIQPAGEPEPEEAVLGAGEPEVIGKDEEEADSESKAE
ncbi:50S ribosomal protein L25 [Pirellulimonas nuda]|uniref:Large ribosomal subunit protein bL25 n=1 Tax=Pirellulimonas nuda TaxID=2528009 RepID=A0A518D8K4_9BACT|nr:50S ribosomal protein L25 [Pirellulimonas nuda]QDU87807.1 50S ribosomal protein L25 [Pirellulimonas nuda]